MLEVLPAIADFFWQLCGEIFDLYTTSSILAGFFVLYILDRMFGIFDILKR